MTFRPHKRLTTDGTDRTFWSTGEKNYLEEIGKVTRKARSRLVLCLSAVLWIEQDAWGSD